jgi:coenzyme F420-0:L-glutamate ligase/coenzyme F420-1:gamma-L-glutamate ligase
MITAVALEGLPEITPGFDLAQALVDAVGRLADQGAPWSAGGPAGPPAAATSPSLNDGDVVVIAHKAISKREGRVRKLAEVQPGAEALRIATAQGKDPRHVQVVLDESRQIVREANGVLICETRHGFICANAGVDASNVGGGEEVLMLPLDPDASARELRAGIKSLTGVAPGVIVTDSFGRAWRGGQVDITVGCAGIRPLEDWRGGTDSYGRELHATIIAVADELAAAADLARRKDGQQPAVLVRGAGRHVTAEDGPGATALIRPPAQDLFR